MSDAESKLTGDPSKTQLASIMSFLFIVILAHSSPVILAEKSPKLGTNMLMNISRTEENQVTYCGKEHLYDPASDRCKPCDNTSYMDEYNHRNTRCKRCPLVGPHEYLKSGPPCPRDSPPNIACLHPHQFYSYDPRDNELEGHCTSCRICDDDAYVGRSCGEDSDTVCCPFSDMSVNDTLDGPRCINETISPSKVPTVPPSSPSPWTSPVTTTVSPLPLCGEHQFYQASSGSCQTCPPHTFLNKTEHRETKCLNYTSGRHPVPSPCDTDEKNYIEVIIIIVCVFLFFLVIVFIGVVVYIYCCKRNNKRVYIYCCKRNNKRPDIDHRQSQPEDIEMAGGENQPEEAGPMLVPADVDNL